MSYRYMADPKKLPAKKKESFNIGGSILDGVGWVIGQAVLPFPERPNWMKKKKVEKK